ncbi:MAG: hypothetical protein HYZ23_03345 [Chloroflexi bacterium]|nr:hypothetical protein [Chloroflexota bacterium]
MNLNSTWSALEESMNMLGDDYGYSALFKRAEELAPESNWLTWIPAVSMFAPETFTVADFMRLFPYGLAQLNEKRFAIAVQRGYLTADDQGGYCATESGKNVTRLAMEAFDQAIASIRPLSDESFQSLVGYLHKLVEATFATAKPTANFLFCGKRNMRPLRMEGLPHQLEQYISELAGYRDDCYFATWSAHGVEGHAWELLDRLSQSDALTFDELHEKSSGRGVTREVHAADVQELARRGWADDASGKIQITEAGKQVRAEVEAETERLFFAPWSSLNESELDELANLASQLRDKLKGK